MKHYIKKLALIPTLTMMAIGALAQDTSSDLDGEQPPDLRRYTVELIIFSYAKNASAGTEIFVPDAPPPEELVDDALNFDESIVIESIPEIVEEEVVGERVEGGVDGSLRSAITMLQEGEYQLIDIAERLDRLDAYEPLMHFGWTQPTYPDEEPETRPLSSFMTPPDGLAGDLTLYLSRYLHLSVQLQLDAADSPKADTEYARYDSRESYRSFPVRYRIDEDRIFKNGDARYYDHPKFGVIAKITRVEEEEPPEEPEIGEMLGDTELVESGVE